MTGFIILLSFCFLTAYGTQDEWRAFLAINQSKYLYSQSYSGLNFRNERNVYLKNIGNDFVSLFERFNIVSNII